MVWPRRPGGPPNRGCSGPSSSSLPTCVEALEQQVADNLESFNALCDTGDVEAASDLLDSTIRSSALAAGMGASPAHGGPRSRRGAGARSGHQPWYDEECVNMRAALLAARRDGTARHALRQQRRQLSKLLKRKRRSFWQRRASQHLEQLLHDPKRFWRTFNKQSQDFPAALDDPTAAVQHFSAAFAKKPGHSRPPEVLARLEHTLHRVGRRQSAGSAGQSAELDADVSEEAVHHQLRALQGSVSAGPAGLGAQFFKCVVTDSDTKGKSFVLTPLLTRLFNACLTQERVPSAWPVATITPIPKAGGAGQPSFDNFRPIAVGSVLPKLFASVLNRRLVGWAEDYGKHSPSCDHHLFNLRHMFDTRKKLPPQRRIFYGAFIDLRKAYDSVNRDLLWLKLRRLGVSGRFLGTLQSMYTNFVWPYSSRVGSPPFLSVLLGSVRGFR